MLGVLLVLEVELNPTTFVRFPVPKNLSSPRPDGDPLGALLLLPLPLLLGPPRLLQPLLPRLVDLDLLLPALLAAERHVTSAITKTATPPSVKPFLLSFFHAMEISNPLDILDWWWCCCLPVHEDVSVAGQEFPAAEADVEVVVVAVELVGVVAGVAEHAAGPPRRGRRLQRGGGGVAGEAGLEVFVSLRGDGVVVRHFSLALCLFPRRIGALLSLFRLGKEGSGLVEGGEAESEELYILEGDGRGEGEFLILVLGLFVGFKL